MGRNALLAHTRLPLKAEREKEGEREEGVRARPLLQFVFSLCPSLPSRGTSADGDTVSRDINLSLKISLLIVADEEGEMAGNPLLQIATTQKSP